MTASASPPSPPKRGRGQPTKRTPEREKIILDALKRGRTQRHAEKLAGLSRGALRHWCEADSSFSSIVEAAIAEGEDKLLRIIEAAAGSESDPNDAKAAQWLLAKRFWKKYGERSRVDAHVKLDVEKLSDRELDERIARLERAEALASGGARAKKVREPEE